ncbi:SRPBCC family protein [Spirulina sp. 06S082]|uniref:SRPBCC family protein n=1 Tax=Spirulina sp. 06S082 TaxID=3110248 RepID=UPI002B20A715|nr:SRPBCC family protein [Spirulina sp. 06S082]MEA5468296.1 SRPBCC family protein [Spirulina sp. 06S082]
MVSRHRNRYYEISSKLTAIPVTIATLSLVIFFTISASAQQSKNAFEPLSARELVSLKNKQAIVSSNNGQFVGRIRVDASVATAWQVLTDYDNLESFFPYVETSRLLRSVGNRRIFEQVNIVQIFSVSHRSRVVVEAIESYPQKIGFRLVEGDMNSLQGSWQIEPIPNASGRSPTQTLIVHKVNLSPKGGRAAREIFFATYSKILEDTLVAIKQETEKRVRR